MGNNMLKTFACIKQSMTLEILIFSDFNVNMVVVVDKNAIL